jgi:3-oxoacyl-[acyl-carrier protein] reductase
MELGIRGRVAVVAGASAGLGLAAAEALAAEGARVVLASRDPGRIAEAARHVTASTGEPAHGVAVDVREPDAGDRLVAAARERFGDPSILITNAGGPAPGPFAKQTLADFEDALRLSFLSAVVLTRAALPAMQQAKWGRIVHVASTTIHEPSVGLFLSSSVRPAVAGFSKALSREVAAFGITVNVIAPGLIATDRLKELGEYRAKESGKTVEEEMVTMGEQVPLGRLGRPDEFGSLVAFLCSERAAYVTGEAIRLDGGRTGFLL